MSNGFTVDGQEVARNSSRGGSVNWAHEEAGQLEQLADLYWKALSGDSELMSQAPNELQPRKWAEMVAKMDLKNGHSHTQLPEDWKTRLLNRRHDAFVEFMCSARG